VENDWFEIHENDPRTAGSHPRAPLPFHARAMVDTAVT
jgi:hypothetical protein